jgi:hypothetical protein
VVCKNKEREASDFYARIVKPQKKMAHHLLVEHAPSFGQKLVSSYSVVGRSIETSFFQNVGWISLGVGVFIGGWVLQFLVGWIVWKIAMCGKPPGSFSDHIIPEHAKQHELPLYRSPQAQQTSIRVESSAGSAPDGIRNRMSQIPTLVQSTSGWREDGPAYDNLPHPYRRVKLPYVPEGRQWHGKGTRLKMAYESAVQTFVTCLRVVIVIFATVYASYLVGISLISVAASLGLVSLTFSMAASSQIANVFAGITISATGKIQMRDFIEVGPAIGEVDAMKTQWVDVVNRFSPRSGKKVVQVPNRALLDNFVTLYPDGPPPYLVERMEQEYKQAVESNSKSGSLGAAPGTVNHAIANPIGYGGGGETYSI